MALNKNIGNLGVTLTADAKQFGKGMENARRDVETFGQKVKRTMSSAALPMAAVGVAATAMAFKVQRAVEDTLEKLDKIGKSAKNIGLTAESFQELSYAAELSGVGVDLFQKSMAKLEKASEDAIDGLKTSERAFAKMGISVEELRAASPEELLNMVADGMSNLEDPTQQAAIAMQLFGTRGLDMLEFLKNGSKGLDELRQKARDLGIVLSNELIANAEKNNDKLTTLKKIVDAQWVQVWADWAPTVLKVSEAFAKLARDVGIATGAIELSKLETLKKQHELALQQYDRAAPGSDGRKIIAENIQLLERQIAAEQKRLDVQKKADEQTAAKNKKTTGGSGRVDVPTKEQLTLYEQMIKDIETHRVKVEQAWEAQEKLDTAFQNGTISSDEYREKLAELNKILGEDIPKSAEEADDRFDYLKGQVDELGKGLSDMAMDGKFNFKDMINEMIADWLRFEAKTALMGGTSMLGGKQTGIVPTLISAAGSFFGGAFGGARAGGGRVYPGYTYSMNELRGEAVRFDSAGTVDPHPGQSAGSSTNVPVAVNIRNTGTPQNVDSTQATMRPDGLVIDVVLKDLNRGGPIASKLKQSFGTRR